MRISGRTRTRLLILAIVVLISALVGIGFVWLLSRLIGFPLTLAEFENGARNGMVVGGSLVAFLVFYERGERGAWLRRRSFAQSFALRTLAYASIIVACFVVNRAVSGLLYGGELSLGGYLGIDLVRDTLFSFGVFFVIFFVLEMRRLVGGRTLMNVILGRYHRPRREERVVMLIDIKGSTAIAERLGDERAHAFVSRTFFEVERPVVEAGGEIYAYVGDLMIVTWPRARGLSKASVIFCWLEIERALVRAKDVFERLFGAAPEVRTAIHAGPVAIGECGDAKLQIVYIGDTMNVAGRLEQMTKTMDRGCLISEEIMNCVDLPPTVEAEALGALPIRGRERPLQVFALQASPRAREGLAA